MTYFTADWILNDPRIGINGKLNLLFRYHASVSDMNITILNTMLSQFSHNPPTKIYHLGDVMFDNNAGWIVDVIRDYYPNCEFNLIVGNHDESRLDVLGNHFDNIYSDLLLDTKDHRIYLNHYPVKCKEVVDADSQQIDFGLTGHIHGMWRVQRQMINVGIDVWNYRAVSLEDINFQWNAICNHYDENVFPNQNI